MWINFLRFGSLFSVFAICFACSASRSEWVHKGEWVYSNASSHYLEIRGGVTNYGMGDTEVLVLEPGESRSLTYESDGLSDGGQSKMCDNY